MRPSLSVPLRPQLNTTTSIKYPNTTDIENKRQRSQTLWRKVSNTIKAINYMKKAETVQLVSMRDFVS